MKNQSNILSGRELHKTANQKNGGVYKPELPEILVVSSFPPRECGIATYSQDLIKALTAKFNNAFTIRICALESSNEKHVYAKLTPANPWEVTHILNTDQPDTFTPLAESINHNPSIQLVLIQHEFGFFRDCEEEFKKFLRTLTKPVVIGFHTVLPRPDESLKRNVQELSSLAESVIVMTRSSEKILVSDYAIPEEKIAIIPHGTHLVLHTDTSLLKEKYRLSGRKVLTTFGLLSSGKSIETTLDAMPAIIEENPEVMFLVIGKTHPSVVKRDGEKYREMLIEKVAVLKLEKHVRFINQFVPLRDLLEYLQLTDIYLFTSKDHNQAVSGTFSYAISCGCPIISTPIPHALEVLKHDAGIIVDFENPNQLANAVNTLLADESLQKKISSNGLHRMASTAWENAAIAHALLIESITPHTVLLRFTLPPVNLDHIKKSTTDFGMIQFSKMNQPDIESGYTLDDNARALIAICQHYQLTAEEDDLRYLGIYVNFIRHCLRPDGYFLNYVDERGDFTVQNETTNLEDSNGRAIWALGYFISISDLLPTDLAVLKVTAGQTMKRALTNLNTIHSTRAMAFAIKGLYYYNTHASSSFAAELISVLADRLVQMYRHEADTNWQWFESYLTYANSVLPEALLCAWLATGEVRYKEIAKFSFDFLLSKTFEENRIKVISNKTWLHNGKPSMQTMSGEQPIDVAYTILALVKFYDVFQAKEYLEKLRIAFEWFLGNNHLHQIIYNPCTGGCYDGLEDLYVNLNQGAESTVSYLMARLSAEQLYPALIEPYSEVQRLLAINQATT